jgi:RNA-binding protein PNO1
LKKDWEKIYTPIVEHMGLQVRMNPKTRVVELRTSGHTEEDNALQKSCDFVDAYMLGFDVNDAISLLRLDDIYVDSFEVKDVKNLQGDHLSRAIARIVGKNGSVKFTIENSTKTRIVVAGTHIHILGSQENSIHAKNAICDLILGSPPGQVYNKLRIISNRMKEQF